MTTAGAIAVVGLGAIGMPMAGQLIGAGFEVRRYDPNARVPSRRRAGKPCRMRQRPHGARPSSLSSSSTTARPSPFCLTTAWRDS